MNKVSADIYRTQVSRGVALAWVNSYSAVVIKTPGATLLFDPVGMEVPSDAPLDLIAITHGHSDHWEPALIAELQGRTGSTVAASPSLAAKLRQSGEKIPPTSLLERGAVGYAGAGGLGGREAKDPRALQDILSLLPGDQVTVGDATVSALRCDHAAVEPLAFQVSTLDGVTVYLPGDTTPFPEMAQLPNAFSEKPGHGQTTERGIDVLCWMGTALADGAKIASLVQPKVFLSYAITPPAAGDRAYEILTALTPDIPFQALDRHQVFLWPGGVKKSD